MVVPRIQLFCTNKILHHKIHEIAWLIFLSDTYSGRFINFLSNHPKTQKAAIIKNLVDSATLLSHPSFHEKKLETIKKLLLITNYPLSFIDYHIDNRISQNLNKINNVPNNNTDNNKLFLKIVFIPYHENISFTIRRILADYNLETVFRVD